MKILFVVHDFNNYGGIINHTEQLMAGFKDLGHEVHLECVKPSKKTQTKVSKDLTNYVTGEGSGYPIHQGSGWGVPYSPFLSPEWVTSFIQKANSYDLIVWESIFGFKCQETEGETDWVRMVRGINQKTKQVVIVHDGNLLKFYPWIWHLRDKISGLACVHPSAFNSAERMEIPRSLIVNPQKPIEKKNIPFSSRLNQVLSLQTFKRWKRVDNLVAAVPHMRGIKTIIAGDGIERAYMASVDKCKPEYYCTQESDPAADNWMLGKRIWQNALDCGMEYIGFISETERDNILDLSKFLIDTSWSKSYGSHFNRVIVDAMRVGVVPIARNLGVSDNEEGIADLLKPGENYLMIPWDATPFQFSEKMKSFMEIPEKQYMEIVERNWDLVDQVFNRKKVAEEYISLSRKSGEDLKPLSDKKVKDVIDSLWTGHFGFSEKLTKVASLSDFL